MKEVLNFRNILLGLLAALCFTLSLWQINRAEYKDEIFKKLSTQNTPKKVNAKNWLDMTEQEALSLRGKLITLDGNWVPNATIYLDNRSHDGVPGVHVVSAFSLDEGKLFLWVNRGWALKGPGQIDSNSAFKKGELYQPVSINKSLVVGRVETDLMRRLELSGDENLMREGHVWQNLTWERLDKFATGIPSLSEKKRLPLIVWMTNVSEESGLKRVKLELDENEKFKHLSYAVQWVFFGIMAIVLAFTLNRKSKNVD